jgi:hypothetical protein
MKGAGDALFKADLALARASGVRGFPTMIFSNAEGERQGGLRCPLLRADGRGAEAACAGRKKASCSHTSVNELFKLHPSWCAQEAALMLNTTPAEITLQLDSQVKAGKLQRFDTRNGSHLAQSQVVGPFASQARVYARARVDGSVLPKVDCNRSTLGRIYGQGLETNAEREAQNRRTCQL